MVRDWERDKQLGSEPGAVPSLLSHLTVRPCQLGQREKQIRVIGNLCVT
ncbi:hypothetical protein [Nostoc sp.]